MLRDSFTKSAGIVALVGAERHRRGPIGAPLDHRQRREVATCRCQTGIDEEAVAVLHQRMAEEGELRLHAESLAIDLGVGIGRARMRHVGARLAPDVRFGSATAGRRCRIVRSAHRLEVLRRRPSLDERPIDAEVVGREKPLHFRLRHQRRKKSRGDSAIQQTVTVLRKGRVIPHRLVDADAHKSAKQQVELETLHQQALRTHRVERLQQHRP